MTFFQNETKTEAFRLAKKLSKDLNKARDWDWITRFDLEQVKKSIKIVNNEASKLRVNL